MSDIKKLFIKEGKQKTLSDKTSESHGKDVESERAIEAAVAKKDRFLSHVRFHPASASNFARYGSAKKYYEDAIKYIADQYPYDGTLAEKTQWELSASQLDLYIYNDLYPRTTGYANLSSTGWGTLNGSVTSDYGLPNTLEYIQLKGGPNTGSASSLVEHFYFHKPGVGSNLYQKHTKLSASYGSSDVGSRESNLKTDLDKGVTVEFWLKKPAFTVAKTIKEVVFDLWNGNTVGTGDYGRLIVEIKGDASASPFRVTCVSGSSGYTSQTIGSAPTVSSLQNWAHYAVSFKNDGSKIRTRLYVNGQLDEEKLLGSDVNEITGSLIANIGALRATPVAGVSLSQGAGKFSGSIDDFRFWKTERDHKQIGRQYWGRIYGGTNTDAANTHLGVYYKFNEGITGVTANDETVLDYSGRTTNGYWVGYPGSSARNTGSAAVESGTALSETTDPIIWQDHPDIVQLKTELENSGSLWDDNNNTLIYNTFPFLLDRIND